MINIEGLNKAKLLMALYDYAYPLAVIEDGHGMFKKDTAVTVGWFEEMLKKGVTNFSVVYGKPMHVDVSGTEINEAKYDDCNGYGSVAKIVNDLIDKNYPPLSWTDEGGI